MRAGATLYRLFDADDELMYVGVTEDFGTRLYQHEITLRFGTTKVTRWELEEFELRDDAFAAEAAAILHEDPPFNLSVHYGALTCRCDVCLEAMAAHAGMPLADLVARVQRSDAFDAAQRERIAS